MDFLNFVMALSPIVVVLVGILGFRQSAKRVAPVALLWTLLLAFTYFNVTGAAFKDNVAVYDALLWKGIKEGLKIVLMVFGAFVILNLLRDTGAIDEVKGAIARISDDRRVQVVISCSCSCRRSYEGRQGEGDVMFRHVKKLANTSKIIMDARIMASRDRIMVFMSEHTGTAQVPCA